MKKIIAVCLLLSFLVGCSGTYIAKPTPGIRVLRGDVPHTQYTEIALIESERLNFYLFGIEAVKIASPEASDQLNDVVNNMLVKRAKKLGANAIINVENDVSVPYFPFCFYKAEAKGLAVKLK